MRANQFITNEMKQRLDAKCWKGKHKEGTKIKGGIRVNNCVPNESMVNEKSTSEKQARFMAAAAHDPKFAQRTGIKQSVAKEFNKADTGTKQLSNAMKHKTKKKVDEQFCEECGGSLAEAGKASRALCTSGRPDADLGASNLASCKSQGLRARDGEKSHLIGHGNSSVRVTVGGKKIKGKKYGGPLPDYGTRKNQR